MADVNSVLLAAAEEAESSDCDVVEPRKGRHSRTRTDSNGDRHAHRHQRAKEEKREKERGKDRGDRPSKHQRSMTPKDQPPHSSGKRHREEVLIGFDKEIAGDRGHGEKKRRSGTESSHGAPLPRQQAIEREALPLDSGGGGHRSAAPPTRFSQENREVPIEEKRKPRATAYEAESDSAAPWSEAPHWRETDRRGNAEGRPSAPGDGRRESTASKAERTAKPHENGVDGSTRRHEATHPPELQPRDRGATKEKKREKGQEGREAYSPEHQKKDAREGHGPPEARRSKEEQLRDRHEGRPREGERRAEERRTEERRTEERRAEERRTEERRTEERRAEERRTEERRAEGRAGERRSERHDDRVERDRSRDEREEKGRNKDRAPTRRSKDRKRSRERRRSPKRKRSRDRDRDGDRDQDRSRDRDGRRNAVAEHNGRRDEKPDRRPRHSRDRPAGDSRPHNNKAQDTLPATAAVTAGSPPPSNAGWYRHLETTAPSSSSEEEDEEATVQRQLEDAARRRAAIRAKYEQAASPLLTSPVSPFGNEATGTVSGSAEADDDSDTDVAVVDAQRQQNVERSAQEQWRERERQKEEEEAAAGEEAQGQRKPQGEEGQPSPTDVPLRSPVRSPSTMFDMFSDNITAPVPLMSGSKGDIPADDGFLPHLAPEMQAALRENWDDDDGYYAFRVGEIIRGQGAQQYKVVGKYGRGVFSIVLRCSDLSDPENPDVALKVLRSNEHMTKCGMKEMEILKLLMERDRGQRKHCVQYLGSFEHKNHLCIAFEPLKLNMRELLRKYGKDNGKEVGLALEATRLYTKQLMLALKHLKDNQIVHADVKPDNILLSEKCNVLKLADFGSASYLHEGGITPYLVSRFYRPPEVILGLPYDCAVDMWSAAVTIYEIFTGRVCFPGRTNNNMLWKFMEMRGKIPNKMLKRAAFCEEHFNDQFQFKLREADPVSKKEVVRLKTITGPEKQLKTLLLAHTEEGEDRRPVLQLVDFLDKGLAMDPAVRIKPEDTLRHPFIAES